MKTAMRGQAFAVCGPSGAGKDTLIAAAAAAMPEMHVVRRCITRPAEAGGEPFEPVSEAAFARLCAAGAFALHWRAHGLGYGIPRSALDALAAGRTVVFNASRVMLTEAAGIFPGLTVIHVTAAPETLARRLAARGRESRDQIAERLERAARYAPPAGLQVVTVANDGELAEAARAFIMALRPKEVRCGI